MRALAVGESFPPNCDISVILSVLCAQLFTCEILYSVLILPKKNQGRVSLPSPLHSVFEFVLLQVFFLSVCLYSWSEIHHLYTSTHSVTLCCFRFVSLYFCLFPWSQVNLHPSTHTFNSAYWSEMSLDQDWYELHLNKWHEKDLQSCGELQSDRSMDSLERQNRYFGCVARCWSGENGAATEWVEIAFEKAQFFREFVWLLHQPWTKKSRLANTILTHVVAAQCLPLQPLAKQPKENYLQQFSQTRITFFRGQFIALNYHHIFF